MLKKIKIFTLIIKKAKGFLNNKSNTTANCPKNNINSLRDLAGQKEFKIKVKTYKKNYLKMKINFKIKMQIYFIQTNKAIKMKINH